AAFEQQNLVHAKSFRQLHVNVREGFRISRQELRQDALDRVWRRSDLEYARVSPLEQLDAFPERRDLTQYPAAICKQLLASGGQKKTATNAVKQLESTFVFEIADLS